MYIASFLLFNCSIIILVTGIANCCHKKNRRQRMIEREVEYLYEMGSDHIDQDFHKKFRKVNIQLKKYHRLVRKTKKVPLIVSKNII